MLFAPDVTDAEIDEALAYCTENVNALRHGIINKTDGALELLGAYIAAVDPGCARMTRAWLVMRYRDYVTSVHPK